MRIARDCMVNALDNHNDTLAIRNGTQAHEYHAWVQLLSTIITTIL